jgi:uncharacterized protein
MINIIGNPTPFGLICFGMATLTLMYLELGWVETDFQAQVAGMALTLGGFGEVLVGIFELIKGSAFAFTVFECNAAFWFTYAFVYIYKSDTTSTIAKRQYDDGMTLYLAQWTVLNIIFWIVTLRRSIAVFTVHGFNTITVFLFTLATGTGSSTIKTVAGMFGFMTGVSAMYAGAAFLINAEFGYDFLPGLRLVLPPRHLELTSANVASLIYYNDKSKTLLLQFRGLCIETKKDVDVVRKCIERAIKDARVDKVHVMTDYDDVQISDDVAAQYWEMIAEIEQQHCLSASCFRGSFMGASAHEFASCCACQTEPQSSVLSSIVTSITHPDHCTQGYTTVPTSSEAQKGSDYV